jgi:uncharacterized protein YdeI (YjbR/CyaY-like superfamily)
LKTGRTFKTLHLTTREDWRTWLEKHHDRESEVWLVFYKRHTGKPRIAYDDAVEEALCFGWIDSLVKRLDEECYAQKFTPRKAGSKWSDSNRARVKKLLKAGLMTEAGRAVLENRKAEIGNRKEEKTALEVGADVTMAIQANAPAAKYFATLPPGYVRMCMKWINDAKRPATRTKRIAEFVGLCAGGKRIGLK